MEIVQLIIAAGLGSWVTVFIQAWLTSKSADDKRAFIERREAYVGLLKSWRDQDIKGVNEKNWHEVGHWLARCRLVSSAKVYGGLAKWNETEPGSEERRLASQELEQAMRADLIPKRLRKK